MSAIELESLEVLAGEILAEKRIPGATYRLQFNPQFTFTDAAAIVPYLRDLGISDCYASPILRARPGSKHGYDICDHNQLNPELGGETGFTGLSDALRANGMGLLLDTVPNHMAVDDNNPWWLDVLENGPSSTYASYFDIDWHPVKPEIENKVLLPILEDQYGKVLESGKLRLCHDGGAFMLRYYSQTLPIAPRTYSKILNHALGMLSSELPPEHQHLHEMQSILTALNYLPLRTEVDPDRIAERFREKEVIKRRLATLYADCAEARRAIEEAVQQFNGEPGNSRSFDLLDDLIDAQAYRASFWRVSADEINYRRFFDINDLAAVCVERAPVFEATHHAILRLLEEGRVQGLRIDHPDGLWDPPSYFRQLQQDYLSGQIRRRLERAPSDQDLSVFAAKWLQEPHEPLRRPFYVVAEKILSEGEQLPGDWLIDGTTGYDFLNAVNAIFVDAASRVRFSELYGRFIGREIDFSNLVNSTKKTIMLVSLASEIQVLAHRLDRISEKNRRYKDFTLNSLTFVLREVIAALPLYRTYIARPDGVTERDRKFIEGAVAEARKRNPRTARAIFDFIRDTLLLSNQGDFLFEDRPELLEFVMKFQQLTGPIMAKGMEDTAFYVYNRLASLNEVGGNPASFGSSLDAFHRHNLERCQHWPHSLLATSTHDTKRSEDVRARINVLSEMPAEWAEALSRWSRFNGPHKIRINDEDAPDPNDEYLLYQTLVGAWPVGEELGEPDANYSFRERIAQYLKKATREAKIHTSWINPNEAYDEAVRNFVIRILDDSVENPFLSDILVFQKRVAFFGRFNSLSQALLKFSSPGVPDLYQGMELWDLSLVDPDNRRPVNYAIRRGMLSDLQRGARDAERSEEGLPALLRNLLERVEDGRIKLYVTWKALSFRRLHHRLFFSGDYLPLAARGARQDHVCAFARVHGTESALVVVPRLVVSLARGVETVPVGHAIWGETRLLVPSSAGRRFRDIFTGATLETDADLTLPVSAVLGSFPVSLLERIPD